MLQDALSEVTKFYPPLKLRVFVDDLNKVVAEMAKKVMKKVKEEVNRNGAQIVSDRRWDGRKEQNDCFVWLHGRAASMQQR